MWETIWDWVWSAWGVVGLVVIISAWIGVHVNDSYNVLEEKFFTTKEKLNAAEKELEKLKVRSYDLHVALRASGALDYHDIHSGQRFCIVTRIEERVVSEHGGKWGTCTITKEDDKGIQKMELTGSGWLEKSELLQYMKEHRYLIDSRFGS